MVFVKCHGNRLRIEREIRENHAKQVNMPSDLLKHPPPPSDPVALYAPSMGFSKPLKLKIYIANTFEYIFF